MTDSEITYVKGILTNAKVLEFGSGGSTITFAPIARLYHSVEHDKQWFDNVGRDVSCQGLERQCVPPVPGSWFKDESNKSIWSSLRTKGGNMSPTSWDDLDRTVNGWHDYTHAPDVWNEIYDCMLVDGRARPECVKHNIHRLRDGGYVLFHDWTFRPHYHIILERMELVDIVDTLAILKVKSC